VISASLTALPLSLGGPFVALLGIGCGGLGCGRHQLSLTDGGGHDWQADDFDRAEFAGVSGCDHGGR